MNPLAIFVSVDSNLYYLPQLYVMYVCIFLAVMQHANFFDICYIPELNVENYKIWKERILLQLGCMDIYYAIKKNEPPINKINTQDEIFLHEQREHFNRLSVIFTKTTFSVVFVVLSNNMTMLRHY